MDRSTAEERIDAVMEYAPSGELSNKEKYDEALRLIETEGLSQEDACQRVGLKFNSFKSRRWYLTVKERKNKMKPKTIKAMKAKKKLRHQTPLLEVPQVPDGDAESDDKVSLQLKGSPAAVAAFFMTMGQKGN